METKHQSAAVEDPKLRPPGPRSPLFFGNVGAINKDPLGALTEWARRYGDFFHFKLLNFPVYLVARPELIEQVLVTQHRNFRKSRDYRGLAGIFGNGLLTSEGEFWMRQRRLMQPAFSHHKIPSYAAMMAEYTEKMLAGWQDGEERDAHEEMMALTLRIVTKALFGADVSGEAGDIGQAIGDILRSLKTEALFFPILQKIPTRRNRRYRAAISRLDRTIYRIIEERRRGRHQDSTDVLGMLLAARDQDGSAMSDEQLRDEMMTLFLAGHETTALALSWTWYLLALHPEVERKLWAELDTGVSDSPYARMVLQESMRLYPPVWGIGREALAACDIGGYRIPAGSQIWISQWIAHHDERYFEQPDRFLPERWAGDLARRLPRFAYFPFGGGPRLCIGQSFALMEAVLILTTVARRFRLTLAPEARIVPLPSITLRPRYGVPTIVSRR